MEEELANLTSFPINKYTIAYIVLSIALLIVFGIYKYKNKIDIDASDKNIRELLIDISRPEAERRAELLLILKKRGIKVISEKQGYVEYYRSKEFSIWKFVYLTVIYIVPGIFYVIAKMCKKKEKAIYEISLAPSDKGNDNIASVN